MSGSNHHFTQAVDCKQCISADFEYAITVGNQFDLSFFDITAVHMNISGYTVENFCRFIFVKNTLLFFPNIKMFFSDGKKCRNIFFANDVTFFKENTLFFILYNLCYIMAKYMPDSIFCTNLFHCIHLLFLRNSVEITLELPFISSTATIWILLYLEQKEIVKIIVNTRKYRGYLSDNRYIF